LNTFPELLYDFEKEKNFNINKGIISRFIAEILLSIDVKHMDQSEKFIINAP